MRKLCKMLFLCALLAVAVLQFTGCGNGEINWQKMDLESMESEKRAEILAKAVEQEMNKLDSYTRRMDLEFVMVTGSTRVESTATEEVRVANQNSDGYQYRAHSTSVVKSGKSRTATSRTEGYRDGVMYFKHEEGYKKTGLYSDVSKEDFIAHLESNVESFASAFIKDDLTCTQKSEKTENGWLVKLSAISDSYVKVMEKKMGITTLFPNGALEDIEFDFYITEQMLYEKVDVRFIMREDVGSATYKFEVTRCTVVYSDFNETVVRNEDISEYEEVADLRVLYIIDNSFDAIKNSENGNFTLFLSQKLSGAKQADATEISDINYKISDGKITYTCESTVNDEEFLITFENGEKKEYSISEDGEQELKKTTKTPHSAQIAFIEGLIETLPFDKSSIRTFTETDVPGQYKLEYIASDAIINQYRATGYAPTDNSTYFIYVTIEDGRMVSYEIDFQIIYRNSRSEYIADIESETVYKEY